MTGTERGGAGPAALRPGPMTETEFRSLYERLRGQLPWGPDDRRGALNYITPAEILAAVGEVTLGRTIRSPRRSSTGRPRTIPIRPGIR